jgi:hypothetical protein
MTTVTHRRRAASPARGGYGFRTVAAMEWQKLRTTRSTWYIVALFAVAMTGLAVVVLSHEGYAQLSAAGRASFDPTHDCFIGLVLGQLLLGVAGVLAITSEFSSGMIRATFAAVPRRGLVLGAKAAVLGAVTLAAGEIVAFAAFFAGQASLQAPAPHAALGQPGVLRAVLMAGAYPALIALIGLGIGAIIRHTAGAICVLVGVLFVLPLLFVSPALQNSSQSYLPHPMANVLTSVRPVPDTLPPGVIVRVRGARARGRGLGARPPRRLNRLSRRARRRAGRESARSRDPGGSPRRPPPRSRGRRRRGEAGRRRGPRGTRRSARPPRRSCRRRSPAGPARERRRTTPAGQQSSPRGRPGRERRRRRRGRGGGGPLRQGQPAGLPRWRALCSWAPCWRALCW